MGKNNHSGPGRIAHHVTKNSVLLADCLQQHFRLDAGKADELISLGAVYSDHQRLFSNVNLPPQTYLRIHLTPKRYPVSHIDWQSQIVGDEKDFLVVNKPANIPVHATVDNSQDNVLSEMRRITSLPLQITQRLDVPATGLLVLAKNESYQASFNQKLADRKVFKRYLALVRKAPTLGSHVHFMEKSERSPKRISTDSKRRNVARCELEILSVETWGEFSEIQINLMTGRTHQIRAQLGFLGCPLVGDRLYGDEGAIPPSLSAGQIALHAAELAWNNGTRRYLCDPPWSNK